jgi:hypothetical protein
MKRNIDNVGRAVRGGIAILLLAAGACLLPHSGWLAIVSFLLGVFAAFEAIRGWCAARACGIRTRL